MASKKSAQKVNEPLQNTQGEENRNINTDNTANTNEWFAYYEEFSYFSAEKIRKDCHPRIMEHKEPTDKAIVLVHGLTDSPYVMTAIADHFYNMLGYNVYLPLLHFHGLKNPKGMDGVDLNEWKANVLFAINTADSKANFVSVGGLSTGGTLSFYMACTNSTINGDLYLFSAALDLAAGPKGIFGNIIERILRIDFVVDVLDKLDEKKPLIGKNPYRYDRMDLDGARELSTLIKETDALFKVYSTKKPFPKRVFAAHSESDTSADINEIFKLQKKTPSDRFTAFIIPKEDKVAHASLVLKDNIEVIDPSKGKLVLEAANPKFTNMMLGISEFQED